MMREPNRTTESFAALLAETFERGDQASLGAALGIPPQHVNEWVADVRRSPFEAAVIAIEQLRKNGNARANELFLAMARRLGFVAYQETSSVDDVKFATLLREFSDVVNIRAEVESDGVITPEERRKVARRAMELAECATAYAREQLRTADAEDQIVPIRRTR
jgi:hypothetical protein